MKQKAIPFNELMKGVLDQLKSQRYMESTSTVYRRTYNRIHAFLNECGTDIYTHELGAQFIADSSVCKSTLAAYTCAIRRLDDFIDSKPYRCHHADYSDTAPEIFSDTLTEFLAHCEKDGNKPLTVQAKERSCISFLNFIYDHGCLDLAALDNRLIYRALLTFSNKDHYARIRQFLVFLEDEEITVDCQHFFRQLF